MKLYVTPMGHWTGTQADAKKLAKQHNTTCDVFEVPVDKKGLLDFLNEHQVNTLSDDPAGPEEATAPVVVEDLAGYASVVISRLGECIHVEKTEGVCKMRKLREGERYE